MGAHAKRFELGGQTHKILKKWQNTNIIITITVIEELTMQHSTN